MIFGVGINDSDESTVVFGNVSGKRIVVYRCPYFSVWRGMLKRVYSGEYPSYDGVSVCQEWLSFSNFKDWMIHQPYEGRELDKDLLSSDGKVYSPDTCCFLPKRVNILLRDIDRPLLISERVGKKGKTYRAQLTTGNKKQNVGTFKTKAEATKELEKARHSNFQSILTEEGLYEMPWRVKSALVAKINNLLKWRDVGISV